MTRKPGPATSKSALKATQAGQAQPEPTLRERFRFADPDIWTDRMLDALDKGVKGGVWFSLMDKVVRPSTLASAWKRVRANQGAGGVDGQTIAQFERNAEKHLANLYEALRSGEYAPSAILRKYIPKEPGKVRPLGIPTIRDRVVQTALLRVIEPIFEVAFSPRSFGFRPNRGCKDALRVVSEKLRAGYCFVVDADLKSYFDTIPHDKLMKLVRERIADNSVLRLLEAFLKQGVLDELREWTPETGTPQGGVISPLLSNLYLDPLDKLMEKSGREMVRYADDFVVLCQSRAEAETALDEIRAFAAEAGLTLHPEKTKIVDVRERGGFDFLGYHFERGLRWPRKKSLDKLKERIRGLTPRKSGESLATTIQHLNRTLHGWFEYFKHSIANELEAVDKWVRMRLRAQLRKRLGSHRSPYGKAHQMWPIKFFEQAGLFNLTNARARLVQSLRAH